MCGPTVRVPLTALAALFAAPLMERTGSMVATTCNFLGSMFWKVLFCASLNTVESIIVWSLGVLPQLFPLPVDMTRFTI